MQLLRAVMVFVLVCSTAAHAKEDTPLEQLTTMNDARPWEAVGRLDIGGTGFCTGALITENLVLTAAHCLYSKDTGARINPALIEFRAGWRNGQAGAYRMVRRAVEHPDYVYASQASAERVRNDVAILELAQPILNGRITPFQITSRPGQGARVGVVSYAADRSEAPSLQEACRVMARQFGMLVLSCEVDFGSSGAPVFTFDTGEPRIASVISAKAEVSGERVALATGLEQQVASILRELEAGKGVFQDSAPRIRRIGQNTGDISAKFVRP